MDVAVRHFLPAVAAGMVINVVPDPLAEDGRETKARQELRQLVLVGVSGDLCKIVVVRIDDVVGEIVGDEAGVAPAGNGVVHQKRIVIPEAYAVLRPVIVDRAFFLPAERLTVVVADEAIRHAAAPPDLFLKMDFAKRGPDKPAASLPQPAERENGQEPGQQLFDFGGQPGQRKAGRVESDIAVGNACAGGGKRLNGHHNFSFE